MATSILEKFLILFETDASGADKAEKAINKLQQSAKGLITTFVSIGAVVSGLKFAANYANQLDTLSKVLNISVEDLSLWGDAVHKAGGTAQGFYDSIRTLTTAVSEIGVKGKSRLSPFFQELGINALDAQGRVKSTIELLPEIAGAFEKLSRTESFGIGQKLGLDQGTILLLQSGRREVDILIQKQRELGVVTKADAEAAAKFTYQWDNVTHAFRTLFTALNFSILPVLGKVLSLFEKVALFFAEHKNLIIGALLPIGIALTAAFIVPLIKIAALLAPLAIFALIFEDILGYYQGHDSVLGKLLEKYPRLIKVLKTVEEIFISIGHGVKNLEKSLEFIFSLFFKLEKLHDKIYSKLPEFLKLGGSGVNLKTVAENNAILSVADKHPLNAFASGGGSLFNTANNRNASIEIGQITIQTQATDAKQISLEIGNSIESQIRQALSNFDDGVMA